MKLATKKPEYTSTQEVNELTVLDPMIVSKLEAMSRASGLI